MPKPLPWDAWQFTHHDIGHHNFAKGLLLTVACRSTRVSKPRPGRTLWTMGCVSPAASRKKTTERKKKSSCAMQLCQTPTQAPTKT